MKKLIIALTTLLIIASCKLPYSDYNLDLSGLDVINPFEVSLWIHENITYKSDAGEYWQTPSETWERKTGDCEDMAILAMYICKVKFNIKPMFIALIFSSGQGHAIFEYNSIKYDPTLGDLYNPSLYPPVSRYVLFDYDEVMHEAEFHRIIVY